MAPRMDRVLSGCLLASEEVGEEARRGRRLRLLSLDGIVEPVRNLQRATGWHRYAPD